MVKGINVYRRYALAGATFSCAISIGFLMQSSEPGYAGHQLPVSDESTVERVVGVSVSHRVDSLPRDVSFEEGMSHRTVALAISRDAPVGEMPDEVETPNLVCDVSLSAEPLPAALVALELTAPCLTGERVVVHHGDLKFSDIIGADGSLAVTVPALVNHATFVAILANGRGATVTVDVPSLQFYERVAVQWQGETGLGLHAREYGADYNSAGHVWREAQRDVAVISEGNKGFLTRLGNETLSDSFLAEIYTFPSEFAKISGEIALSIEAEISAVNCEQEISAGSIEVLGAGQVKVHDLSFEMPSCDAMGELLVLKNLLQDLKIAAN